MDVHPSMSVNPEGPTSAEPFAPEAIYELKIDTNRDAVADIAYRMRVSASEDGAQSATVRRVEGTAAAETGDGGEVIIEDAPVSMGQEAQVTQAGDYRFFAGWRSDPFFYDVGGALNDFRFTGSDYFADKDVCSIVLELPNSELEQPRLVFGTERWSLRMTLAGSRRTEGLEPSRSPSLSPTRRRRDTWPASHRMTPAS
jgi:hypothetical protein